MISTQAQALQRDWEGDQLVLPDSQAANFTVEQCNQIANISKRTIKAAIIGVPIAEVINKFTVATGPINGCQFKDDVQNEATKSMNAKDRASGYKDYDYCHAQMEDATNKITAIYNTVNQIKSNQNKIWSG